MPACGDPLGDVVEELLERRRVRVGVDEDERPPGLELQRDEAEVVRVDATLACERAAP